jgi:hypothetical protein
VSFIAFSNCAAIRTKGFNGSVVRNAENLTFRGVEADIKD